MSTTTNKVKGSARVQVTVEVTAGTWGDDCSIGQLYRQAEKDARDQIENACRMSGNSFRFISAKVIGVLTEEER